MPARLSFFLSRCQQTCTVDYLVQGLKNDPQEIKMLMNPLFLKGLPARRLLGMVLILILAIAVTSGFIHIRTDQVIAPPALRVLDWLWRAFVWQCPF